MISTVEIQLWCGKQVVELDDPVDNEDEALRLAIEIIRQSLDCASVSQTW